MRSVKTQIFSQRIERLVKNNDNKWQHLSNIFAESQIRYKAG